MLGIGLAWAVYLAIGPLGGSLHVTASAANRLQTALFWCLFAMTALAMVWRSIDSSLPMWCALAASVGLGLSGLDDASRIASVFSAVGLAARVASAGSRHQGSADGVDAGSFVVVLVFDRITRATTWQEILHVIRDSAGVLAGSGVSVQVLVQGADDETAPAPFSPDALAEIPERLSTARYELLGVAPSEGRIEMYRDDPFDFLLIHPPDGWSKQDLLGLGFQWHHALDPLGLRTILGGAELRVRAADVRDFRDDAEHGYAIQGLEYSSPNLASLHRV